MTETKVSVKKSLFDILKVSASNIIGLLSGILVGFLLPKFLGVSDYGYYKTFTLYAGYVGLFHFGILDGIYLAFGGKDYDELDKKEFRFYTLSIFCIESVLSVIALVISLFFIPDNLRFIFICLAIYLVFHNMFTYYKYISQITSRFKELSIVNIFHSVLSVVFVSIVGIQRYVTGLEQAYFLYTVFYISIEGLLLILYCIIYRKITFGSVSICKSNFSQLWFFVKTGIPLMVANLCTSLMLSIDRQFVNVLFDKEVYATYSFAYNMLALITTALSAISTVIYPTLKKIEESKLQENYSKLVQGILVFTFFCLVSYFPLCWFIGLFLPKYTSSLPIFRVILPGLAISSSITIVMHNYYKVVGKENLFFFKTIIVLAISFLANLVAYSIFKTTISISIASIIVMFIWYSTMDLFFIRKYHVNWIKNILFILSMCLCFYLITLLGTWWFSMVLYLIVFSLLALIFYRRFINELFKSFRKEKK